MKVRKQAHWGALPGALESTVRLSGKRRPQWPDSGAGGLTCGGRPELEGTGHGELVLRRGRRLARRGAWCLDAGLCCLMWSMQRSISGSPAGQLLQCQRGVCLLGIDCPAA
jgi:hypothetical protein